MLLRRSVEVVRALLWLASGRFLAGIGRVVPSEICRKAHNQIRCIGPYGLQLRLL